MRPVQPQRALPDRGLGRDVRVQGLVRRPELPDQPQAAAHRRMRLGRPHDLHRLRSVVLLLQGWS